MGRFGSLITSKNMLILDFSTCFDTHFLFPSSPEAVPVQVLSVQRVPEGQPEDPRPVRPPQALRQQPVPRPPPATLTRAPGAPQTARGCRGRRRRVGKGQLHVAVWDLMLSWQQQIRTVLITALASP